MFIFLLKIFDGKERLWVWQYDINDMNITYMIYDINITLIFLGFVSTPPVDPDMSCLSQTRSSNV